MDNDTKKGLSVLVILVISLATLFGAMVSNKRDYKSTHTYVYSIIYTDSSTETLTLDRPLGSLKEGCLLLYGKETAVRCGVRSYSLKTRDKWNHSH